jgi:type I restriction enzyme R subunit
MTAIKHRESDTSYEIYLAFYQSLTGSDAGGNAYREFLPDFLNLIVVDKCHLSSRRRKGGQHVA